MLIFNKACFFSPSLNTQDMGCVRTRLMFLRASLPNAGITGKSGFHSQCFSCFFLLLLFLFFCQLEIFLITQLLLLQGASVQRCCVVGLMITQRYLRCEWSTSGKEWLGLLFKHPRCLFTFTGFQALILSRSKLVSCTISVFTDEVLFWSALKYEFCQIHTLVWFYSIKYKKCNQKSTHVSCLTSNTFPWRTFQINVCWDRMQYWLDIGWIKHFFPASGLKPSPCCGYSLPVISAHLTRGQ